MSAFIASYSSPAAAVFAPVAGDGVVGDGVVGDGAAGDGAAGECEAGPAVLSERASHQLAVLNLLFETADQNAKIEAIETAAEAAAESESGAAE